MTGEGGGAPAAGPVTMRVEPEKVLALKTRLEAVRDSISSFIVVNRAALRAQPLALDEVSQDAAVDFSENADTAIEVTRQFVEQLTLTITALENAVHTYKLTDDKSQSSLHRIKGNL
ncbi:PE domain-containing protein [Umezawaea beigongshangensis]|uniref:PE domain-containing protein n=1 Tax=Umezawaea beigongshangensis TaxID=2780383 RepID=UPI0018F1A742|nr:PE domain-containing protein [Umezawaea beigongshangensis]